MRELGEMIRNARGNRTGLQLAERSGVPSWKISRIETGSYKDIPDPDVIKGLANALGIPQYRMLQTLGYEVGPPSEGIADPDPALADLIERLRRLPLTGERPAAIRRLIDIFADLDRRAEDSAEARHEERDGGNEAGITGLE